MPARGCGCTGSTCGCKVQGGTNVVVTGNGTAAFPYTVSYSGPLVANTITVDSNPLITLERRGSGTVLDPYIIEAILTAPLSGLTNVSINDKAAIPNHWDVLQWDPQGSGSWEYRPIVPHFPTLGLPSPDDYPAGFMLFDTTIGRPRWNNASSTAWVDSIGAGGGGGGGGGIGFDTDGVPYVIH